MNTKGLIAEAISLPVEERALMAVSLLKSLNLPETDIDKRWVSVAQRRLDDLRSGRGKPLREKRCLKKFGSGWRKEIFISS